MTSRDSGLVYTHDPSTFRRQRSHSTASTRSRSPRSPSPIITFTPTPLSPDAKGVKNITRKVIRTLEGLGHLEDIDMTERDYDSDDKHDTNSIERAPHAAIQQNSNQREMPIGTSTAPHDLSIDRRSPAPDSTKKIDWEIPRKLLHSSIGFITVYLYISEGNIAKVVFNLSTALAIIVPADILRLNYPPFERIYERVLGFLMRESEKKSSNGVIWYILGVNFALTFYPQDVATVAILILSWADTSASTFGRLWGSRTPRLPSRTPVLGLPLAPRKSLAGFLAAAVTGTLIAIGFWGWIAPVRNGGEDITWTWDGGARVPSSLVSMLGFPRPAIFGTGGWIGLGAIGLFSGLVSGVAEALDLGSLDDNLTLPIISGGCILGFLKLLGYFSSS